MVYSDEVQIDALRDARDALRPLLDDHKLKLTYLPFFLKAASLALNKYPTINASIDVENMELTLHGRHDLGVAVNTPRGLAVPVVRNCEQRSVEEIALELGRLKIAVSSFGGKV